MIVTQYSPWLVRGNAQAQQVLHRFFNPSAGEAVRTDAPVWQPPVDIREEASRFVILADLPGVDLATVDIQMDKGVLSLKGARDSEARDEATTFARTERGHGSFDRRFTLPDSADADAISAVGKNGVLEISIPKKAQAAPRRIAING